MTDGHPLLVLGLAALGAAALFAWGFRTWRRCDVRARLFEVLARAARRGLPFPPLLERAAAEQRGRMRRELARVHVALAAGEPLSVALGRARRLFAGSDRLVVAAAEGGSGLSEALAAAARDSMRALELRHRVSLLCLYPAWLLALLAFTDALSMRLVREIRESLDAAPGARAYELGAWLTPAFLWAAAGGVTLWLVLRAFRLLPGRRQQLGSRLLSALAPQVAAGVPLPGALRRVGAASAADGLEAGAPLEEALRPLRLPRSVLVRLAAATGRDAVAFGRLLRDLAADCDLRHRMGLERLLRWGQPVVILVIAVLAALQFASIMQLESGLVRELSPW